MGIQQQNDGEPSAVAFGRYDATPPTLADGDLGELQLTAEGVLKTASSMGTATAAVTSVSQSDSSGTLLTATAGRVGFSVYNDATDVLHIRYGTGDASTSDYSVQLAADAYFEDPYGYSGALTCIWAAAGAGSALVTEWT